MSDEQRRQTGCPARGLCESSRFQGTNAADWEQTGILEIGVADTLPHGWQFWRDWQAVVAPDNAVEIQAVEADRGSSPGYVRLVGRRRAEARLEERIVSISRAYTKKPLLRAAGVE